MRRTQLQPLVDFIVSGFLQAGFVVFLTLAISSHGADLSGVKFGPPGDWVRPQMFNGQSSLRSSDPGANDRLRLLEHQINAGENEEFFHLDREILTMDGVENDSTLKIDFDPNYETLTWNWARIWRDGQHFDRLDTNSVQVVRREQDLDEAMLNGEKTAILVLNDVRVGDVIDYAYSLKGENPISAGHFSAVIPVQEIEPADRLLTRLLWPRGKGLYAIGHGCSVQPITVTGKDTLEVTWDFPDVPGATVEDSLPEWFDPEHWVQVSDFKTWAEVNQWALKLFESADASPFSAELSAKIDDWKRIPNQEEQILSVLRFVQDEVRYFGIEIGASSEKPASPSMVFSRRFGDCKDKSLLFVAILRALGIQAFPVLVNAAYGRSIESWQPSVGAFDHCIARVQCYGQNYYLDPTMTYQRGPLTAHYLPNYGYGLVISPWTTRLTVIPQTTGLPETTTTEYFRMGMVNQPATLKVVTVAEGRDADVLRETFATIKQADIEKNYTHFYSVLYPEIKMSQPITVEDDEDQDRFQTTESYSINNMWTRPEKGVHKVECEFFPSNISALLKKPIDTDRALPLGVSFPEHQILRTEVSLPIDWSQGTDEKSVNDPAFSFRKLYQSGGNKVVMEYEYQALADSVAPEAVGDYLNSIDRSAKWLGNTLTWATVTVMYP
ncbi:MAG TPA: DUF3857 domain-containing transglutaminase family protein [Verrucomicrobiae bacterium]|nr:DUF3857 domain-containing transglutaminase family protein [Verrucomicrobiae bacterium]